MGEMKLGKAPDDLEVYEMAWELRTTPDVIRAMSLDDFYWMRLVPRAKELALEEMQRRAAGKKEKNDGRK